MCPGGKNIPGVGVSANIDIKADFTESINRISGELPRGFAKLTHLMFGKRDAEIARYKILACAQTHRDCMLVLAGQAEFRDGKLMIPGGAEYFSSDDILAIEQAQGVNNLAGNVRMAIEDLSKTPDDKVSDAEVDPDFFSRWRRDAKVIGNEDLQRLWGRLLAEEIRSPRSIGYRTLDVLKNISSDEARTFCKVASCVCSGETIICDTNRNLYPLGCELNTLSMLEEAGLIVSTMTIEMATSKSIKVEENTMKCIVVGNLCIVDYSEQQSMKIVGISLTSAGRHVMKIAEFDNCNKEQLGTVCEVLAMYAKGCIKVHPLQNNKVDTNIIVYEKNCTSA